MQSKIKRKLVSLMLAASFVGSPLATFPMQVFAGTGSNGVMKAPTIKLNPALLKMQIGSKIDSAKYEVKDSVAFSVGGNGKVVSEDGTVSSAGIICVTDKKTGVEKYVVSDAPSVINYVLEDIKKQLKDLEDLGINVDEIFEAYPNLFGQRPEGNSSPDTPNSLNVPAIKEAIEALAALAEKANKGEKIDDVSAIAAISKASQAMESIVEEKVQQDPNNEEFRKQLADVQKQTSLLGEASSAVESAASSASKSQSSNTPKKIEVSKITIKDAPDNINRGQTVQLTAEIGPSNATDKKVMWSSSNEDVAIVSSRGRVTAFGIGETTITATAKNGSTDNKDWKTQSITITVRPNATSVKLKKSTVVIAKDQTETLQATVLPEEADQTVVWSSSDETIVTVDKDTGEVTGVGQGIATITATTDNGLSATCQVFVDMVVVKANQTPLNRGYTQGDIIVDPVKLTFSEKYKNLHDRDGWFTYGKDNIFTLTVKPADGSNITIQKCIFYHEWTSQSYTSDGTPFSCEAFTNRDYYGITQVDVYFTRNS